MEQSSLIVVWSNQWFVIWAQNLQHVLNSSPINEIICIIIDIIVIIILQAIRQWDQALREKNDYRDALAKVKRKFDYDDASLWYQWYHATNQYLILCKDKKQLLFEQKVKVAKINLFVQVQRQHEEAVKEINQAMAVRIKVLQAMLIISFAKNVH